MTYRPILRLPKGSAGTRLPGQQDKRRRPRGAGSQGQGARFNNIFERLERVLTDEDSDVVLRYDPTGIAPERALVFETTVPITDFKKAADKIQLEVLIESTLGDDYEIPEELVDEYAGNASPTLYATMPSSSALNDILKLWRGYQKNETAPRGLKPLHNMFAMLIDLRVWGPKDRLTGSAQAEIDTRLPLGDDEAVKLELEIWPTTNEDTRSRWQQDTRARVEALGGRFISQSSINEHSFIYEAVLIEMPAGAVRNMIRNPFAPDGLATIEGLQFVLPQTIAQSLPDLSEPEAVEDPLQFDAFDEDTPIRAVILDGTPIAGHRYLNGGVVIEDVHDLVPLSQVQHRRHATSMASLILRGDLLADCSPVKNSRLLSIPVLIDNDRGAFSPDDRLFVDVVHIALTRAFLGEEPLAPDAFLVNFSIGIMGTSFSGRISSLARLLDWWADQQGVLFVVSAGNVPDSLVIPNTTSIVFEGSTHEQRKSLVEEAQRSARHKRTILAPSEAINVLTVGATSHDLTEPHVPQPAGEITLEANGHTIPALSSATGLGPFRSIKPDIVHTGGRHDIRMQVDGPDLRLNVVNSTQRTGLNVAAVRNGTATTYKTRGTSCASALVSRAHLNAAAALFEDDGPFQSQDLGRRDLSLLTKALAINASQWNEPAKLMYTAEIQRIGANKHSQAREEICRYFGHGVLQESRMTQAPEFGATLVGTGTIRKDQAMTFELPLPAVLSEERIGRFMRVTITWFSPVLPSRARYRLAALDAVSLKENSPGDTTTTDKDWGLDLTTGDLDTHIIKRGSVWSRRLKHNRALVPRYGDDRTLPIHVQCRDASGGGLSPDEDIGFALAVTLELENETKFDIHTEIQNRLRVPIRRDE